MEEQIENTKLLKSVVDRLLKTTFSLNERVEYNKLLIHHYTQNNRILQEIINALDISFTHWNLNAEAPRLLELKPSHSPCRA